LVTTGSHQYCPDREDHHYGDRAISRGPPLRRSCDNASYHVPMSWCLSRLDDGVCSLHILAAVCDESCAALSGLPPPHLPLYLMNVRLWWRCQLNEKWLIDAFPSRKSDGVSVAQMKGFVKSKD
jgi:hypothetical protein